MFLLLLFFIARIVLKRKPFSRVVEEIRGKNTAKLLQGLQDRITKLIGYRHIFISLLILTEAFFQYGYHDMVESSMRGKFGLFFKDKIM